MDNSDSGELQLYINFLIESSNFSEVQKMVNAYSDDPKLEMFLVKLMQIITLHELYKWKNPEVLIYSSASMVARKLIIFKR